MTLNDLIGKTCWIGLSYFDLTGELLKQTQLGGTVSAADEEDGITVDLFPVASIIQTDSVKAPQFHLPPDLNCWFNAPQGTYRTPDNTMQITDPDYLVTWDIHQTQDNTEEGKHEWWEWIPRTASPTVG